MKQFVKGSRPDEKSRIGGLRHVKTRLAGKEWKHVVSEKLASLLQVCQANYDCSRRAISRKLKSPHRRIMQHKYTPNYKLPPIAEDGELGFEEALAAETHHMELLEMKIYNAKPRQHSDVRNEIRQGKCIPKINTPSVLLENLVVTWTKHGGNFVVIVLLATVISGLFF